MTTAMMASPTRIRVGLTSFSSSATMGQVSP
jgi:hypothetical protein